MARLRIECQGRTQDMPMVGEVVILGRGEESTIVLDDKQASRQHCQIERCDGGYKVVDLESRNGTKVNGTFVNQHLLRNGDRIEVGAVVVTYLSSAGEDTDPSLEPLPAHLRKGVRPTPATTPSPARAIATAPRPTLRRSSGGGLGTTVVLIVALGAGGWFALQHVGGESEEQKRARVTCEEGKAFEKRGKYDEALASYKTVEPRQAEYYELAQQKIAELEPIVRNLKLQQQAEAEELRIKEIKNFAAANKDKQDEVAWKVELFRKEFPASKAVPELTALVESLKKGSPQEVVKDDGFKSIETVAGQFLTTKKFGEALKVLNQYLKENPTSKDAGRAEQMARDLLSEAEIFFAEKAEQAKTALLARQFAVAREAYQSVITGFGDEKTSLHELVMKAKNELKRIDDLERLEKK